MSVTRFRLAQLLTLTVFALGSIASAQSWNTSHNLPWSKPGNSPAVYHNGKFYIVSGDDGIWSSSDGSTWNCVLKTPPWAPRKDFTVAAFNGKIYVMGGRYAYDFYNDVWSSTDGVAWNRDAASANWTARGLGSAIVFNNRLWLIGGVKMTLTAGPMEAADYQYFNEAWSTADGITWESTASIPWAARAMPGLAIFNNQLTMIGGFGASDLHDVWVSDNGTNWTQKTSAAPWGEEWSITAAPLDGKLWALGGMSRKIWNSTNGSDWAEAATAPWPATWGQSSIVSGSQLYTIAGGEATDSTALASKIWRTSNGTTWTHVGGDKQIWSPRMLHRTVEYKGNIWMIGGMSLDNGDSSQTSEVWRANLVQTPSGPSIAGWDLVTRAAPWRGRWAHGALNYNGKMWILGGCDDARSFSDVWSSTDGSSWTLVTANAWPKRAYHGCVVHDNKMWVVCGTSRPDSQTDNADVYWSTDGLNWNQTNASVPFQARRGMGLVSFGGKLWIIGGCHGGTLPACSPAIYSTTNGISWTHEGDLPFGRKDFATAVFDGKIWLYGGTDFTSLYRDVWSSTDGIHWNSEGTAPWSARQGMSALWFNNSMLLLMGGNAYENLNDVWAIQYKNGAEKAWMKLQ